MNPIVTGATAASIAINDAVNHARLATQRKPNIDFYLESTEYDVAEAYNSLGLPIHGRIILGEGEEGNINTYYDYQGNKGTYTTMILDSAVVTANFNQQVVKTYIQGRSGSVKEFISSGDMDISISGVYSSPNPDQYPEKFVSQMYQLLNAPTTIPVNNKFLNLLGINTIVFTDGCSLPQANGGYANQNYVLKALSDTDPDSINV